MSDVEDPNLYGGEPLAFGQPPPSPFLQPAYFDGTTAIAPRRHELLTDREHADWSSDLHTWIAWLRRTFGLRRAFPPCWAQHPALVEEATALHLAWSHTWLPAADPTAPWQFLYQLDASLARIENRWQIPCTPDRHTDPAPVADADRTEPATDVWWSSPQFDPHQGWSSDL